MDNVNTIQTNGLAQPLLNYAYTSYPWYQPASGSWNYCPTCGRRLTSGWRYCPGCGSAARHCPPYDWRDTSSRLQDLASAYYAKEQAKAQGTHATA